MAFFTTKQVAKLLGIKDDAAIRKRILRGSIKAKKSGIAGKRSPWLISESEVSKLKKK